MSTISLPSFQDISNLPKSLAKLPGVSALTTQGTWANKGLNYVQALGVDEYTRLEAIKNNTEEKEQGAFGKVFQLVAPQYYSTFKLADGKISQLLLAGVIGQQRYEGMKMAQGPESSSILKAIAGILYPNAASSLRTLELGARKLTSEPMSILA